MGPSYPPPTPASGGQQLSSFIKQSIIVAIFVSLMDREIMTCKQKMMIEAVPRLRGLGVAQ